MCVVVCMHILARAKWIEVLRDSFARQFINHFECMTYFNLVVHGKKNCISGVFFLTCNYEFQVFFSSFRGSKLSLETSVWILLMLVLRFCV